MCEIDAEIVARFLKTSVSLISPPHLIQSWGQLGINQFEEEMAQGLDEGPTGRVHAVRPHGSHHTQMSPKQGQQRLDK